MCIRDRDREGEKADPKVEHETEGVKKQIRIVAGTVIAQVALVESRKTAVVVETIMNSTIVMTERGEMKVVPPNRIVSEVERGDVNEGMRSPLATMTVDNAREIQVAPVVREVTGMIADATIEMTVDVTIWIKMIRAIAMTAVVVVVAAMTVKTEIETIAMIMILIATSVGVVEIGRGETTGIHATGTHAIEMRFVMTGPVRQIAMNGIPKAAEALERNRKIQEVESASVRILAMANGQIKTNMADFQPGTKR